MVLNHLLSIYCVVSCGIESPPIYIKCGIESPIGVAILSTVRKAARLAVYELIMIKEKNHQIPPIILINNSLY